MAPEQNLSSNRLILVLLWSLPSQPLWMEPETQGLRKNHFQGLQHLRWTGNPYPQGRAERISQGAFTWGLLQHPLLPLRWECWKAGCGGASGSWNLYPSFHSFLCSPPGGAWTLLRPLCLSKAPKESLFFCKTWQDSLGAAVCTHRERPPHSSKAGAHNSILGPVAEPGGSESCTRSAHPFTQSFTLFQLIKHFLGCCFRGRGRNLLGKVCPFVLGRWHLNC